MARSWKDEFPNEVVEEINEALLLLDGERQYEQEAPTLKATVARLEAFAEHCEALSQDIMGLSPVAVASLHDAAMTTGDDFGPADLRPAAEQLPTWARTARSAAATLLNLRDPSGWGGQGSGSSAGREADSRALPIGAAFDDASKKPNLLDQPPIFRSPKDRFGVRVILTLARHARADIVLSRGARTRLDKLLNQILADRGHPPATWREVLDKRNQIFDWALRRHERERSWRNLLRKSEDNT